MSRIENPGGPAGSAGPQGPAGSPGAPGLDGIDGEDGEQGIPGPQGVKGDTGSSGAAGAAGAAGPPGMDGLDGEAGEDGVPGAPGPAGSPGAPGADGAAGAQGPPGPPGLDAEEPEFPYIIPGERGPQGPAGGGGGGSWTVVETNVGSVARTGGSFTITDAAITPTSKVIVLHAPGPYTGKGTRADEAAMDPLWCVAEPGSGNARVRWHTLGGVAPSVPSPGRPLFSPNNNERASTGTGQFADHPAGRRTMHVVGRVRGNIKFQYTVAS